MPSEVLRASWVSSRGPESSYLDFLVLLVTNNPVTCLHSPKTVSSILTHLMFISTPDRASQIENSSNFLTNQNAALMPILAENNYCWGSLESSYLDPSHVVTWPYLALDIMTQYSYW